ncbi:DUF7474 family protein [Haladaptatus salinisoli]|uniref:DUF7474 family protein n=1 Tax=Haladaptatus salinisoli TaxID=2884876 RepID=UPI001D0B2281|nr:hypothetical protein [Haladaptatus salinisoli]
MPRFAYPCPDCRTTTNLHGPDCQFDGEPWTDIEKAYTDIVAALSTDSRTEEELRESAHGRWDALRAAALDRLRHEKRVVESDGALRLLTADEFRETVSEPTFEPMQTLYEKGSVPGCHDNAVFAMIAWYEMVGLSWPETRENVVEWLHDSGTWARGGFEESTPEELVENKRHVYDAGYGWKEKAEAAKAVIDRNL